MIAKRNIDKFMAFLDFLGAEKADHYPRATGHITEIVELVKTLVEKGFAYESGGDVYFEVRKFPDYGKLSKKNLDDLIAGASERVDIDDRKRNPEDFCLWKGAKAGEPSWESPWGQGRPGWHIECSAMSTKYLGEHFDIHGGGTELIFPHHENEIAQHEAATGQSYVNHWVHHGLVNLVGEKMSKSTGHFKTMEEISEALPARRRQVLPALDPLPLRDRVLRRAAERGRRGHRAVREPVQNARADRGPGGRGRGRGRAERARLPTSRKSSSRPWTMT